MNSMFRFGNDDFEFTAQRPTSRKLQRRIGFPIPQTISEKAGISNFLDLTTSKSMRSEFDRISKFSCRMDSTC